MPNPLIPVIRDLAAATARVPAPTEINMAAFVLRHGQEYRYQPCPDEFPEGIRHRCWLNSWELALEHGLIYVEGYTAPAGVPIPLHHGWCVRPDTLDVIDVTSPLTTHYFGVAFRPEYVATLRKEQIPLLDDWRHEWPLLRLPPEELQRAIFKIEERSNGKEGNASTGQASAPNMAVPGRGDARQRKRPAHRQHRR